jgi:hypothetical protein
MYTYTVRYSYFIPEDGDTEAQPNVFLAPKPRQQGYPPSLGQVRTAFPIPGRYHFRFKAPLAPGTDREKGAMAVWMDCLDDQAAVPVWKNTIVAKVTRIGLDEEDTDEDDDCADASDDHFGGHTRRDGGPHPPPAHTAVPAAQHHHHPPPSSVDFFGMEAAAAAGHTPPPPPQHSADLLGGMHNIHHSTPSMSYSGDLLGMATPSPPVSGNSSNYTPGYTNHQHQHAPQSGPFF